jgi:hypothetical protein
MAEVEGSRNAAWALEVWFDWLDETVDPATGLWKTDRCSPFVAMCGGYHQLLLYYYHRREIRHYRRLIDTVLSLQHFDGGFAPAGGGGACEDTDAVDILVNLYKLYDYRHPAIRAALRRCLDHLLGLQNADGGFPYNKRHDFSHMGIPRTRCRAGESNMFATWFRVHTIALISEVLTDDERLDGLNLRFTSFLSMGWHRAWDRDVHRLAGRDRAAEAFSEAARMSRSLQARSSGLCRRAARKAKRLVKKYTGLS